MIQVLLRCDGPDACNAALLLVYDDEREVGKREGLWAWLTRVSRSSGWRISSGRYTVGRLIYCPEHATSEALRQVE